MELATHILDRKAGHFDPGEFKDEYELALRNIVKRKAAGHTIELHEEEPAPTNVINLMDALRESMKRKKPSYSGRSTNRRKSVGSAGRRKTARRKSRLAQKPKWGVSWQITPRVLTEALAAGGDEAKRAFDAMMGMKKIDIAAIEAARRG